MSLAILLPTIPPRRASLARLIDSIARQTLMPDAIVIATDWNHRGVVWGLNHALAQTSADWIMPIGDDDWLGPTHLEACWENRGSHSVVYTDYFVYTDEGVEHPNLVDPLSAFCPFDGDRLRQGNYIHGSAAMINRFALDDVGGWKEHSPDRPFEDWGLYLDLLNAGGSFGHVPEKTWYWTYGQHTMGKGDRW